MLGRHLGEGELERFAGLELGRDALRSAAWHLTLCGRCRRALAAAAPAGLPLLRRLTGGAAPLDPGRRIDYSTAFARATRAALAHAAALGRDRRRAPALYAALMELPPSQRAAAVDGDPRFRSYGLAERLLAESRRSWSDDDPRAEHLGRLAILTAARVAADWPAGRRPVLEDLAAEAWASIATARRIASDPAGAAAALAAAGEHLRRGSGEPLVRARVLGLAATVGSERRRFDEAERRAPARPRGGGAGSLRPVPTPR
jgi:hypothetical protein